MSIRLVNEDDATQGKLRIGLFGDSGAMKTLTALTMPAPVVIDSEGGTQAYKHTHKFASLQVRSLAETYDAINIIAAELRRRPDRWQTVVFDSATVVRDSFRNALFDTVEKAGGKPGSRENGIVSTKMRNLYNELSKLGLHVVVTAWDAPEYEEGSGAALKKTGQQRPDIDKSFKRWFDFTFQMLEPQPPKSKDGLPTSVAKVLKSRGFSMGTKGLIHNLNYADHFAAIADILASGGSPEDFNADETSRREEALAEGKTVVRDLHNPAFAKEWVDAWLKLAGGRWTVADIKAILGGVEYFKDVPNIDDADHTLGLRLAAIQAGERTAA